MIPATRFKGRQFEAAELDHSVPINRDLRLRGMAGDNLMDDISGRLHDAYPRKARAPKKADSIRSNATISMMLANLIVAALNRLDATRFVATPFANDAYGTSFSISTMRNLRDLMIASGLVRGQHGYRKWGPMQHTEQGHLTRLQATPALHDLFAMHGITWGSVTSLGERLIRVTKPVAPRPSEPTDVNASRAILSACNAALAAASVVLPERYWLEPSADDPLHDDDDDLKESRPYAGDLAAMSLYRRFTGDWHRGGRLYGGFWQSIPKKLRAHLLIDGLATVELDYGYLHPALLFAWKGEQLTFDPYLFPGADPSTRELGKKTLMRLINGSVQGPKPSRVVRVSPEHKHLLPAGMSFPTYKSKLVQNLSLIASAFGTGVGVYLQRQDSDLAIKVLKDLNENAIVGLPIHDSFIVQARHGERLRSTMRDAYVDSYGFEPFIK